MADFKHSSQPHGLSRFVAVFFPVLGGLSGLSVVHSIAHQQPWMALACNASLCLLVGWIGYRACTRHELTLDKASATGRYSWKTLFGRPQHKDFAFSDIQAIRVLGTINWVSAYLDDIPITRALPRGGSGAAALPAMLAQLKALLQKPVQIDPTVARWFQLENLH